MTISHGVLVGRAFVAAALVTGLVSAGVVLAVESATPRYRSQVTFLETPLSGTGEPDRVLATRAAVLESRSLRQQVAATLGVDPGAFTVEASPARLAFAMDVDVEAAEPALARSAATAVFDAYVATVVSDPAPTTTVAPLDPATAATPVRDPVIDTVAAFFAGAAAAAGALALLRALRPRVRARYGESPAPVPLLGVPAGLRRGADVEALAQALDGPLAAIGSRLHPRAERLRLVVVPVARGGVQVAGLAAAASDHRRIVSEGVEGGASRGRQEGPPSRSAHTVSVRVTQDRSSLISADRSDRDAVVAVVLARAGRDNEADLRRTVASVSPLAATVVVVVGSHDNGVVLPPPSAVVPLDGPGGRDVVSPGRTVATW